MTKQGKAIGLKHRVLFPGLKTPIKGQVSQLAKIVGLQSAKAIALLTRSGKMPDRFAPIIGNTFSVMTGPNRI
jgi:hypothetical protein